MNHNKAWLSCKNAGRHHQSSKFFPGNIAFSLGGKTLDYQMAEPELQIARLWMKWVRNHGQGLNQKMYLDKKASGGDSSLVIDQYQLDWGIVPSKGQVCHCIYSRLDFGWKSEVRARDTPIRNHFSWSFYSLGWFSFSSSVLSLGLPLTLKIYLKMNAKPLDV